MKYILLFFLLVFHNMANCQTIEKLDKTNGFKTFKFGMSPSQFQNNLRINTANPPLKNVKKYYYTGDDIKLFHGIQIESIELAFFNNKLYMVGVNFGSLKKQYTVSEQNSLIYSLKANFGTGTHDCQSNDKNSSKILSCIIWDGQRVRLEHLRIDFSNGEKEDAEFNNIMGYLLFTDKKMQAVQQNFELEN